MMSKSFALSCLSTETVSLFFHILNPPPHLLTPPIVFYFSEFPPIANEQERSDYKRIFDREHQEYKDLQAELDTINKDLSNVDKELDELQEGSPQYLVRATVTKLFLFTAYYLLLYIDS